MGSYTLEMSLLCKLNQWPKIFTNSSKYFLNFSESLDFINSCSLCLLFSFCHFILIYIFREGGDIEYICFVYENQSYLNFHPLTNDEMHILCRKVNWWSYHLERQRIWKYHNLYSFPYDVFHWKNKTKNYQIKIHKEFEKVF